MSGLDLWNPDMEEGPDISGQSVWNLARGSGLSDLT
jgi:hypothetical protein